MGSMVLGGDFNVVGDGDDDAYLGEAAAPRRNGLARRRAGQAVRVPTPQWMNGTTSQGVSRPQEEMDWLPFTAVVLATGVLTGVLQADPQRPFRGERMVLSAVNLTTGADISYTAFIDPAMFVGAVQIGGAQGSSPFTAFQPNAFGVRLSMPASGQGTTIKVYCRLSVNAVAAGVQLAGMIFGRAMR